MKQVISLLQLLIIIVFLIACKNEKDAALGARSSGKEQIVQAPATANAIANADHARYHNNGRVAPGSK